VTDDTANSTEASRPPLGLRVLNFLLGRPLASREGRREQIGWLPGIAVLGLDALGSAAYGPEAALTLLIPLGAEGLRAIGPITLVIVAILLIVALSYRQTIGAYPNGGGSYTVAKENLGEHWGVLAGAALGVDYVLNVAVGISAGVGAIVSAFPPLLKYTLPLCLGLLALLTILNLRGVREVGAAFMTPTCLFIACLCAALAMGVFKILQTAGHPQPIVPPPRLPQAREAITAWLLLRAFASGCTAMTGVEAVSNAVPIFREPSVKNARRTLAAIIGILTLMLLGIAWLCRAYHIGATEPGSAGYQSVLSQLLGAIAGRNWFYFLSMAAIFSVLALSANTSFAGFPRMCRLMALDEYLPESFAWRGRRLVYNAGILSLAVLAAILLLVFRGVTNGLIPLFAIGALLSFTLSQAGMVGHWRARLREPHARRALLVNAVGATATALTVVIVMISKFTEGAWITLLLVPAMVLLLHRMKIHNLRLEAETVARQPVDFHTLAPPLVVVPVDKWTHVARKALRFAMEISPDVRAIQVLAREVPTEKLADHWNELVAEPARAAGLKPPQFKMLASKYRQLLTPIVGYVCQTAKEHPGRSVAVLIPELVERRWYHYFFSFSTLLRGMLLIRGHSQIFIITAPWYRRPFPDSGNPDSH